MDNLIKIILIVLVLFLLLNYSCVKKENFSIEFKDLKKSNKKLSKKIFKLFSKNGKMDFEGFAFLSFYNMLSSLGIKKKCILDSFKSNFEFDCTNKKKSLKLFPKSCNNKEKNIGFNIVCDIEVKNNKCIIDKKINVKKCGLKKDPEFMDLWNYILCKNLYI